MRFDMTSSRVLALLCLCPAFLKVMGDNADYGVDCSFPIHYKTLRCGNTLGSNKLKEYKEFMDGCRKYYGPKKASRCDSTENDRIEMSLRQPQSMVNYTSTGYKKIKAPKALFDLLQTFWNNNKNAEKVEKWFIGNIYTNHWAAPTYMVSVEDDTLIGGGYHLKNQIWDTAKSTIEEWTGMELQPTSMYGIRKYTNGAILSPHVDRLPLVSSCIINVDQDVDEPWPLEVIDRQGRAVNVTMEPGDMVLYESGSLIHARPFPLKGRYFANIFIHFEPTGRKLGDKTNDYLDELDGFYPPYLLPNSPELEHWKSNNPEGWSKPSPAAQIQQVTSPLAHSAAANGDLDTLQEVARTNKRNLFYADNLGWQPIHEAARSGYVDVLQFLIENGVDMNVRTGTNFDGASPLNLAISYLGRKHEAVTFLSKMGALNINPIQQEL